MNDRMDNYISRCLKNWTALSRLPVDGKATLLNQASLPQVKRARWGSRYVTNIKDWYSLKNDQPVYPHSHLLPMEPFTLSALWSFHLVSDQHLAV